ncbi:ATP synthase gamma chain [bacterium HR17]|uniref:ATP synthase gamma chain n=1 Tax=Candidatus Fervidibacter japonicus TaxID=2035412 RepID=A0A2H5X9R9_9BACT|nr:ATP synthase gamma chain [bacterium HR17]
MQSLRAIRRKIRAVRNLQKIMTAMKMVAAARLRRVQDRVVAGKPYTEKMRWLVETLAPHLPAVEHPLLQTRPVQKRGLVVVTGDKGLCGAYNGNIIRAAQAFLSQDGAAPFWLYCIGRKGHDFFARRGYPVVRYRPQLPVTAPFAQFKAIAEDIVQWFLSGEVDEVHVAYGEFVNALVQRPKIVSLLPIKTGETGDEERGTREAVREYIFEPQAPELLALLLPRYVEHQVYHILLESLASENAARMNAMSQAADNAEELIKQLTLQANKIRQWNITKELLEITTAVEAMRRARD